MTTTRTKDGHRQAFTLLELLIVISIIALLAAILFPVFVRVREQARRASCQSNLKQIGLGMMQYTQDNDAHFPLLFSGADVVDGMKNTYGTPELAPAGSPGSQQYSYIGGYGFYNTWQDLIQPYVKSSQLFYCPSVRSGESAFAQYYYNPVVSGFFRDPTGYCGFPYPAIPLTDAQISRSAQTFLVIEAATVDACGNQGIFCAYPYAIEQYGTVSANGHPRIFRHSDGMNILHADGHVKWYPAARFRDGDLADYIVSSLYTNNQYFCP
jgi:prepilin-type N-terminal cleavage/methylation domain-containing protein/prepilin-type processing-associated H-X9-DG protein